MKTVKVFSMLFMLFSTSVLIVDIASATIKITGADGILEKSLQSVNIPTQAKPLTSFFIVNQDAVSTKEFTSVNIPTQATPLAKLFIINDDATLVKNLSSASIPTQAVLLTKLFVVNDDATLTKSLLPVNIPKQAIPVRRLFIANADAILTRDLVPLDGKPLILPSPISSFTLSLDKGLNIVSLPLRPKDSFTARSFAEQLGSTIVIRYDTKQNGFLSFVPEVFEGDGFPIEGGRGYIVNLLNSSEVVFTGTAWSNAPSKSISAAPAKKPHWAFLVCGAVYGGNKIVQNSDLAVTVKNLGTGDVAEARVGQLENGKYIVAFVDMDRKDVVTPGDSLSFRLKDTKTGAISKQIIHIVTPSDIARSYVEVILRMEYFVPEKSTLLQNYPNPFNPDTWIPYQLADDVYVKIKIYNASGRLVRTLDLGYKTAGFYTTKDKAAYWDGKTESGEQVSSGVYFYTIQAGDFTATKKMVIAK